MKTLPKLKPPLSPHRMRFLNREVIGFSIDQVVLKTRSSMIFREP